MIRDRNLIGDGVSEKVFQDMIVALADLSYNVGAAKVRSYNVVGHIKDYVKYKSDEDLKMLVNNWVDIIKDDKGNLVFGLAVRRVEKIVPFLKEMGADMNKVERMIHNRLSQKDLFGGNYDVLEKEEKRTIKDKIIEVLKGLRK